MKITFLYLEKVQINFIHSLEALFYHSFLRTFTIFLTCLNSPPDMHISLLSEDQLHPLLSISSFHTSAVRFSTDLQTSFYHSSSRPNSILGIPNSLFRIKNQNSFQTQSISIPSMPLRSKYAKLSSANCCMVASDET